jgi:hypothetical protein
MMLFVAFWRRGSDVVKHVGDEPLAGVESRFASAAEIDSAIGRHIAPPLMALGFDSRGTRRWVRGSKAPIRELVIVKAVKGGRFVATWGVSLDFVPNVSNGRGLRWHRTNASASIDLGVDPMDWRDEQRQRRLVFATLPVERLDDSVESVAAALMEEASAWFGRVSDLDSLPPLFEEARVQPVGRFSFDMYVQHRLAYAFVLAATNRPNESRQQFDTWLDRYGPRLSDPLIEELRRKLDDVNVPLHQDPT